MELNRENVIPVIADTWAKFKEKVENGYPLSSEKTMHFLFAQILWRVFYERGTELFIDFESQPYKNIPGRDKYLDLLIYTNNSFKVALECKVPRKNQRGYSDQTQKRKDVYRDIARLNYLVQKQVNNIKAGFFLLVCNEDAYLNISKSIEKNPEFMTGQGYKYEPSANLYVDKLKLPDFGFEFEWENIRYNDSRRKYMKEGHFAYLKPIQIL